MADLDPELLGFLKTKINTFVKWDLVRFFHENPHTTDTAENIARYAGRDPVVIVNELEELVQSGLLQSGKVGDLIIYTLSNQPAVRDLIARFVAASQDRQFRVKAIYHVIRAMK